MPLLLSIDPGEKLAGVSGQLVTPGPHGEAELKFAMRVPIDDLASLIGSLKSKHPDYHLAYEEYKIYPQQRNLDNHRFSQVKTAECIGIIKYATRLAGMTANVHSCMAYEHKQAVTETWLKRYGFWPEVNATDNPHIRDAVSVGVFWWHIIGLFNGGTKQAKKRVITKLDKEILGIS